MSFYKGKRVLVTGGTGLIGRQLVPMLIEAGAIVTSVSLDSVPDALPNGVKFVHSDLRHFQNCLDVCDGQDIIFQLAGIKGSPVATKTKPASFFVPTLMFSINMLEAARLTGCEWYLNTSSVGVYGPAEIFHEDDVWDDKPSTHDKFAGWSKRIGEMQAEAYKIQYDWNRCSIVRPANVYGKHDSFLPETAMVVPSLIKRALNKDEPFVVWGDGSPIRDFIEARDVARGMMIMVEKQVTQPVNLGSGVGVTIKELAETIADITGRDIIWDKNKPSGDRCRLMDTKRAESYGFKPEISLYDGLKDLIEWYKQNKDKPDGRYCAFTE